MIELNDIVVSMFCLH